MKNLDWKIVSFKPCNVNLSSSGETCYGIFAMEAPGNNTIGRLWSPEVDQIQHGQIHRFSVTKSNITILGDFSSISTPTDFETLLNQKIETLELPKLEKLLELVPDELDLNNELDDTELSELISYSDLRKLCIKHQMFTGYALTLLSNKNQKDESVKDNTENVIGGKPNQKSDGKKVTGNLKAPSGWTVAAKSVPEEYQKFFHTKLMPGDSNYTSNKKSINNLIVKTLPVSAGIDKSTTFISEEQLRNIWSSDEIRPYTDTSIPEQIEPMPEEGSDL